MTALAWDAIGERFYETGVDRGVLYVDDVGYAWSGLVSVDEQPSGGESKKYYIDGIMYLNLPAKEEFGATISAFYSPPEFDVCDGLGSIVPGMSAAQQRRKSFGFSYRTKVANDIVGSDFAYKIHIIYNALATPAQRNHATDGGDPSAPVLAWAISAKPVTVPGLMRSAHLIVDTSIAPTSLVESLEAILYGDEFAGARLPTPEEITSLFDTTPFDVTDLGGGEFEIAGTDITVFDEGGGEFTISGIYVSTIDSDTSLIDDFA